MYITKVLKLDTAEVEQLLEVHRSAVDLCGIPNDDVLQGLEDAEIKLSELIEKLADKAFKFGLKEGESVCAEYLR